MFNCSSAAFDNAVPLQLMMMLLAPLELLHLLLLPWVQIWVLESLQPQMMLLGPLQYQSILLVQHLQPVKVNIRTLKCVMIFVGTRVAIAAATNSVPHF